MPDDAESPDDRVTAAARVAFDRVRADPRWVGRNVEHLYAEALPSMVAAAVRAALAEREVTEDDRA